MAQNHGTCSLEVLPWCTLASTKNTALILPQNHAFTVPFHNPRSIFATFSVPRNDGPRGVSTMRNLTPTFEDSFSKAKLWKKGDRRPSGMRRDAGSELISSAHTFGDTFVLGFPGIAEIDK